MSISVKYVSCVLLVTHVISVTSFTLVIFVTHVTLVTFIIHVNFITHVTFVTNVTSVTHINLRSGIPVALEANETSSVPETSSIPQTSNVERNTSSLPVSYFEYYNRLAIKAGYNLDVNHIVYLYASEVKDDESITQMKEHTGGQCSIGVLVNPASVFTILLLNSSPFQLFCFTCVFSNV